MTTLFNILIGLLAGAGATGCLAFVVMYARMTGGAWRSYEEGRFLVVTYANLGVVFLVSLANLIFDEWVGQGVVGVVLFIILVVLSWWPLRLLHKANREARVSGND